MAYRIGVDQPA
ncbi:hypothetical protein OXX80_007461, partial [Metschnikowia pulcherrima]